MLEMVLKQIYKNYKKHNVPYFLVRIPFNILNFSTRLLATVYWKFFLGKYGNNLKIGKGVKFETPQNVYIGDNVTIGDYCLFGTEHETAKLYIMDNVQINKNVLIDYSGTLEIHSNTLISQEVIILSHSHNYNPKSKSIGINKIIKSNVWIGIRSIVTEKCQIITDNCIISSGSIVTKDCNIGKSIYGGVPAKFIKKIPSNSEQ